MGNYAHPETLVTTDWVALHLTDPKVRIVEVDVDTKSYDEGHVPNAIAWAWNTQLADTVRRDILSPQQFETLMSNSGIARDTTVVIYGDNNNWFAAWAFWQMKIYGHSDVRLMNGGRKKWLAEGREVATETPKPATRAYKASAADLSLRSFLPQVSACPGCGRTTSTFFQEMAEEIQAYLRDQMPVWKGRYTGVEELKVAVMGCVVNGPGESKHADIGISLPGTFEEPKAPVFVDGALKLTLKGDHIVADFLKILDDYVEKRYAGSRT